MHYGWFLIPLISAFIGWFTPWLAIKMLFRPRKLRKLLGFMVQVVIPNKQHEIASGLAKWVSQELFSMDEIEKKIADPAGFEKLMPVIETHIDDFLRVKLPKQMPVIGMFIGDKTINELKSVFLGELQELFPVIMKNYVGGLKDQINIEAIIIEKVGNYPPEKIEAIVYQSLEKELFYFGVFGATIGFALGLIQLLIVCLS